MPRTLASALRRLCTPVAPRAGLDDVLPAWGLEPAQRALHEPVTSARVSLAPKDATGETAGGMPRTR